MLALLYCTSTTQNTQIQHTQDNPIHSKKQFMWKWYSSLCADFQVILSLSLSIYPYLTLLARFLSIFLIFLSFSLFFIIALPTLPQSTSLSLSLSALIKPLLFANTSFLRAHIAPTPQNMSRLNSISLGRDKVKWCGQRIRLQCLTMQNQQIKRKLSIPCYRQLSHKA